EQSKLFQSKSKSGKQFQPWTCYQPSVFQPPAYQAPAPQIQGVSKEDLSAYVKANDAVMRNIQTQCQNMQNQLTNLTDLLTKFVNSNNASTSSSVTLPSNTIANSRSDLKAITIRSGVSYDGSQILPSTSFLPKVVENEPEATKDIVHPTNNESTKDVQPLVVQSKSSILTSEPKLADRSISRLVGVAEDVYVKVGSSYFLADFIVIDFDADPRVPLILGRSILKTRRAIIDVFEGELTLRGGKEAITFNLDQTSRYSANYNEMMAKRIDVIDMACEEYSQEVLEAFLNDNPSLPPPNQGIYLPEVRKELKIYEAKFDKSSIDEPLEVELKDLPPHLEYAFLEGDDKFPVIIAKDLSVKEKTALITVLKSHKRAIAWKLSDIKVHCVPKKGRFTVVENEDNELILTRLVTGWRVCIDYRKLNKATRKDHFPLPFMDQMLERLVGNQYYCFLDGLFGYFQIPIDPKDQKKTTFTAHTERLLTVACIFGYAMHQARFRGNVFKAVSPI
nr:DNA-directed DNA polymerase [Tanacetum cinerariifolium]